MKYILDLNYIDSKKGNIKELPNDAPWLKVSTNSFEMGSKGSGS